MGTRGHLNADPVLPLRRLHGAGGVVRRQKKGDRASALIALVGAINVPIIYFSVKWWNTLHQGSSVRPGSSSMATTMLTAMLIMTFAFWAYSIAAAMHRLRTGIIEREGSLPGCATR